MMRNIGNALLLVLDAVLIGVGTNGTFAHAASGVTSVAKVTPLYLHVFKWPADGKLIVPPLKNSVRDAYLLADKKQAALPFERQDDKTILRSKPGCRPRTRWR